MAKVPNGVETLPKM